MNIHKMEIEIIKQNPKSLSNQFRFKKVNVKKLLFCFVFFSIKNVKLPKLLKYLLFNNKSNGGST